MLFTPSAGTGSHTKVIIACLLLLCFCLFLLFFAKMPSRKLRINRQTITMTDANFLGAKEYQMTTSGAKIRAIHFDFFERLFTFQHYRICSAYHIEISRIGETILFPCVDETEQRQILAKIKEFGVSDVR